MDKRITFIFGAPRSGTTWVWGLLSSHPDTVVFTKQTLNPTAKDTPESGIFHKVPDRVKSANKIRKYMSSLKEDKMLIEKTPTHTFLYDELLSYFPKAKFIYVDRDPRAIVNSMIKSTWRKGSSNYMTRADEVHTYKKTLTKLRKNSNVCVVTYENLEKNKEIELARMYDFLELSYTPELLSKVWKENTGRVKIQPEIFRVGKSDSFKTELTEEQLNYLNNFFNI